jgi:hypothetical protein
MGKATAGAAPIAALDLAPHPEGGWYRETWRGPPGADGRASGTAILFLLEAGQASHWHRVDATEIWFWHAGAPLRLRQAVADMGPVTELRLGPDVAGGESVQAIVAAGAWQAAQATHDWALVSCVVVPGFEFSGFSLAPENWAPGR